MNGGTRPSSVAIATSHGSPIRRRASLYPQYALASQNTATKKIARLRITSHVPELKKSLTPLNSPESVVVGVVSAASRLGIDLEQKLSDDVPRAERDSCKGADHDRREDVDAYASFAPDGTS